MSIHTTLAALTLVLIVTVGGVSGTIDITTPAVQDDPPTRITECTGITDPGRYVLGNDIGPANGEEPCLLLQTSNVSLDGDGYAVDGVVALGDDSDHTEIKGVVIQDLTATEMPATREVRDLTLDSVDVEEGMTGQFFTDLTITDSRFGGDGLSSFEDSGDVVVTNSTFDGEQGVMLWESIDTARIVGNTFETSNYAVFVGAAEDYTKDVLVADNSIDAGGEEGISTTEGGRNIEIRNNEIANASVGIDLLTPGLVSGNDITDNDIGINVPFFQPADDDNDLRIVYNRITDNRVGLSTGGGSMLPSYLHVENNLFDGNDEFGVLNTDDESNSRFIDARNNAWGDPSGPSSGPADDPDAPFSDPLRPELADGSGDAISEALNDPGESNVQFFPIAPADDPTAQDPDGPIVQCGYITEPGTYVLGNDIGPRSSEGPCLYIYSDDVTIDGNGYTIDGTLDLGDYDSTLDIRRTELRDLTITHVRTTRGVRDLTLDSVVVTRSLGGQFFSDVTVTNSQFGQITMNEDSGDIVITNSTFVDGGVTFWEYVTNARLENNEFYDSTIEIGSTGTDTENVLVANNSFDDSSISTTEGGRDIEIRSNEFVNGSSINLLTPGLVVGNNISGGDVGINVPFFQPADDENHLRIVDNRITDNRVGIRIASMNTEYLHIEGNTFDGNTEFGVQNDDTQTNDGSIVDARNNSWGDPSGPSSAPANDSDAPFADPVTGALANGSGDAVSEGSDTPGISNVRFDPVRGETPTLSPLDDSYAGPPQDLDGDGVYEDVNGDGELTIVDVQAFFLHYEDDVVQANVDAFDVNGDGVLTIVDVQALFVEQQGGQQS